MEKHKDDANLILYQTRDGKAEIALYARDGSVWLTQQQMAELFATSKQNVGQHIANVFAEAELEENSVVKNFFTTASDGKRYDVRYYSLEMILAVGFRVRSVRGTQFRQWANRHLREFLVKGFVVDSARLKNPDGRPDYFDELLASIRDIRASEKRFYQKIRELFALSSDYDKTDKAAQMFFAETQNKLLYAVTGKTAAELVVARADAAAPNMGLTSWKGSVVRKQDIFIAKNYLSAEELDKLNRLVTIFLESAELRVRERRDLTLNFWRGNVDALLSFHGQPLLLDSGSVRNAQMEAFAAGVYEKFAARRRAAEARLADAEDEAELRALSELSDSLKKRSRKDS